MMKKIINIIVFPFKVTARGFYHICLLLSKGFYFYFYLFFSFLSRIFHTKIFEKVKSFFKKLQNTPSAFLVLIIAFVVYIFFLRYGYPNDEEIIYIKDDNGQEVDPVNDSKLSDDSKTILNLYKKFSSYKVSDIDFKKLKSENNNTVAWIKVDGTNINYPVLKTIDNSYYLSHDFNDDYSIGGWIFMDYRNTELMEDRNTIIYGHNLINKTAFGSLSNLFDDNWFKKSNHKIIIYTENGKYTYEVFSIYYKDAESYYLTTAFNNDMDYDIFLKALKSRSIYDFDMSFDSNDRIITLSTCTDDNKGRKVVHAKLIK